MDDLSRRRRERQRAAATLAPQNPVFLVTHGEGEDYHIVAAFSNYLLARAFVDRWDVALENPQPAPAIEVFSVDEIGPLAGAFWVTVPRYGDTVADWGYNPTGDADAPADTRDAVELDGVPQHFTGYGATFEAAREAALALRDRTLTEEKERG